MGEITLKKVIIVVLTLMFCIPLFDSDIYIDQANSFDYIVNNLNNMLAKNSEITTDQIVTIINAAL